MRRSDRDGKLGYIGGVAQPGHHVREHNGLKIGDRVPCPPKPTLKINPASNADSPQRGPRGVFRNGTR